MAEYKKGDVILVTDWFFVVIEQKGQQIHCICDNANNIYSWCPGDVQLHLTARQAVEAHTYGARAVVEISDEQQDRILALGRPIPVDVIAEALVGLHDRRFEHWT